MKLWELMKMFAYNEAVVHEEISLYDIPPYGEKTVLVEIDGVLHPLMQHHMEVTDNNIIITANTDIELSKAI